MTKVDVTLPAGSYPLSAQLQANADNAERVWFNGTRLGNVLQHP